VLSRDALVRSPRSPRSLVAILTVAAATALSLLMAPTSADAATFDDTAGTSYERAVEALVEAQILNGCSDSRFCPDDRLTRGQVATILVRALELEPVDSSPFVDLEGDHHAANINALAASGIANGCERDRFCSTDPITREQLATLLARGFDLPAASTRHFDDLSASHGDNVDRVAEAGITSGCAARLTSFCGGDNVLRWQTAVFVARTMGMVDTVELAPLAERREQQAAIDEAERQRLAEEEARRQAEAEAQAAAERDAMWERLAQCESGGNWSINTGNGYYGGLQFSLSSWQWVGGSGYPHRASRAEQIHRAEILLSRQGWNAWPSCSRQLGFR
jgi:hypothetical protein